jgi:arginine-tRNA-protein transferase
LSLVYSFYEPGEPRRSLGRHVILDHIVQARTAGLPFVYLGYWIAGSVKMAYKAGLEPLEVLRLTGWSPMTDKDRAAFAPAPVPRQTQRRAAGRAQASTSLRS